MQTIQDFLPEIIAFSVVFIVLSAMAALYNHSTIIRWIVRFMIFRALMPVFLFGALFLYVKFGM